MFIHRSFLLRLFLGSALALPCAALANAHGDLDGIIASVSQELAQAPSVELLLLRARLHLEHRDHVSALMDCARARVIAGESAAVARCLGQVLLADDQPEDAIAAFERALRQHPQDGETLELRAQVLRQLARDEEALADLDRRESCLPHPQPQYYLDRLAVQRALSRSVQEQLAGIDQGRRRFGTLVVLEEAALRCEVDHGLLDAALARLQHLATTATRPEPWLLQQGDVLRQLDRPQEAQAAYRAALAALEQLPPARRQTAATNALAARVQAHLADLTRPPLEP